MSAWHELEPELEELREQPLALILSYNGLRAIPTTPWFPADRVVELDLSNNKLADLDFLSATRFPALRSLNVSYNRVRRLPRLASSAPNLVSLHVDHNGLNSCLDFVSVAGCQSLAHASFDANPVADRIQAAGVNIRCFFVFLLPALVELDGHPVLDEEQHDAREAFCRADGRIDESLIRLMNESNGDGLENYLLRRCPPLPTALAGDQSAELASDATFLDTDRYGAGFDGRPTAASAAGTSVPSHAVPTAAVAATATAAANATTAVPRVQFAAEPERTRRPILDADADDDDDGDGGGGGRGGGERDPGREQGFDFVDESGSGEGGREGDAAVEDGWEESAGRGVRVGARGGRIRDDPDEPRLRFSDGPEAGGRDGSRGKKGSEEDEYHGREARGREDEEDGEDGEEDGEDGEEYPPAAVVVRLVDQVQQMRRYVRVWVQEGRVKREAAARVIQAWWRGRHVARWMLSARRSRGLPPWRSAFGPPFSSTSSSSSSSSTSSSLSRVPGRPTTSALLGDVCWWPPRRMEGLLPPPGSRHRVRRAACIALQAWWRGVRARRAVGRHLVFSRAAVRIQAVWRGARVRREQRRATWAAVVTLSRRVETLETQLAESSARQAAMEEAMRLLWQELRVLKGLAGGSGAGAAASSGGAAGGGVGVTAGGLGARGRP